MKVGDSLGPLTVRITRETLVRYAGASGDFNPIHFSDHAARSLGLDGVIAHGMLTMALAMRAITAYAGPERVLSQSVRFRRPVPVPDDGVGTELVITGEVTAITGDVATLKLDVSREGDRVLGHASAEVRVG